MATERKAFTPELHPTETHLWFRSKDLLAPTALSFYASLCRSAAHGLAAAGDEQGAEEMRRFASGVDHVVAEMIAWQAQHPELVGLPD